MKNLKTSGNKLESFKVEKVSEKFNGRNVEVIHLTVVSEGQTYKYQICSDECHPDLDVTHNKVVGELNESKDNFEKFEVIRDKKRSYLSINGGHYTGTQLK